jgi:hypothetical protein
VGDGQVRCALIVIAALAGCAPGDNEPGDTIDVIDIRRIDARVEARRSRGATEMMSLDVELASPSVSLVADTPSGRLAIDAVATGPGVPITATLRVAREGDGATASLAITNDLATVGGATLRLAVPDERGAVVAHLAEGPIGLALREVAPYRDAVVSRMAEAAPLFVAVGLFQHRPAGVEPAWPALDDPRDLDPPGHVRGDAVGLGMTCSSQIRCPNRAPFCVTIDHEQTYGFCTRTCLSDAACGVEGGLGRCALSVRDVPDVPGAVLACRVDCLADSCPGLLVCEVGATCVTDGPEPLDVLVAITSRGSR